MAYLIHGRYMDTRWCAIQLVSSSLVNGGPCSLSHNRSIKSLWYPALSWFFCLLRVALSSARRVFTSAGQWMHSSMWLGMCEKLLRRWSAEEEKNRRSSGVPVLVEKEKPYQNCNCWLWSGVKNECTTTQPSCVVFYVHLLPAQWLHTNPAKPTGQLLLLPPPFVR